MDTADRASGTTPLMAAVQGRHAAVVKLLIKEGASLEARQTRLGLTALHLAIKSLDVQMVKVSSLVCRRHSCRWHQSLVDESAAVKSSAVCCGCSSRLP